MEDQGVWSESQKGIQNSLNWLNELVKVKWK